MWLTDVPDEESGRVCGGALIAADVSDCRIVEKAKATAFAIGAVIAIVMMVIIPKAVMPALGVALVVSRKASRLPFSRLPMTSNTTVRT